MEKIKPLTFIQKCDLAIKALETMTQVQIDAVVWHTGGSGCGWTKENLIMSWQQTKETATEHNF